MKSLMHYLAGITLAVSMLVYPAHADTLSLVSPGNVTNPTGAVFVGPYTVSVDGADNQMFCLDDSRDVVTGETWQATSNVVSTSSSFDTKVSALLLGSIGSPKENGQTDTAVQLELWALTDFTGAVNLGLTNQEETILKGYEIEEGEGVVTNAYYNQFTLETAVPGTQSSGGTAQDFIGINVDPPAQTPEPSSVFLFGSGLLALASNLYRKARA